MDKRPISLLLVLGLVLTGVEFPPLPRPPALAHLADQVRTRLPDEVVLAAPVVVEGRSVRLAVLPGASCSLALAVLARRFEVRVDGVAVRGTPPEERCRLARVHRLSVRA